MSTANVDQALLKQLQALSNANRLQIMAWILQPREHFEAQIDGDLVDDGVCVGRIVDKIGLSQPTVTAHMKVLADAGLVTSKKIKNWVFYKPVRAELQRFRALINTLPIDQADAN
ncbi:hypothetical protein GCM10008090_06500 [Arenicella chitinivorans]|uniref:HTH arsR-type domain-containing protein n=2 Tax=Arenicella chitinivorans TaxID=1329800 RepID=A0A918RKW4_9GAMM|nr:metalloregulator ArsR/SmtB family transcription factor [Arenicella chitinivorans]GHA00432.1 hypothetical protein GCM10008090_06500 [Arenicella chitinivorans]